MAWKDRKPNPQPWHVGPHGGIIADVDWQGNPPNLQDLGYYGGIFVCEGMGTKDATFAVVAIRQRDILWKALHEISGIANDATRAIAGRAWVALHDAETEVQHDGLAYEAIRSIFQQVSEAVRWGWPLLPETATRARIEPTGFCYWPSGKLVTDNIELDWIYFVTDNYIESPSLMGVFVKHHDNKWRTTYDSTRSLYFPGAIMSEDTADDIPF